MVAFSIETAAVEEVFSASLFRFVVIVLILGLKYFAIPSFLQFLEEAVFLANRGRARSFDRLTSCSHEGTKFLTNLQWKTSFYAPASFWLLIF